MLSSENCFTHFKESIDDLALPEHFTFPFYYEPHPLCLVAVKELQTHLNTQTQWQHNFGHTGDEDSAIGKMFGVLVVQNSLGEIGYLSAFSGKVADQNLLPNFVPPVFDMLTQDSFFLAGQKKINAITEQINQLSANPQIAQLQIHLSKTLNTAEIQIEAQRQSVIEGRKTRKVRRTAAKAELNEAQLIALQLELSKESVHDKNQLKALTLHCNEQVYWAKQQLSQLTDAIEQLKSQRKASSAALQQALFEQYQFLNILGERKNLAEIFKGTVHQTPPAGSGECAAPKLLHYAFKQGLTPIAIAEFWWGSSPKSEIRQHKNFYAACQGKCKPILGHMLEGMTLDEDPLLTNPAIGKTIDIIYQDSEMAIINKPPEFLSVPGKNIQDCVYSRMKQQFPNATGPLIVHRLDMSTSGLMVIALTKEANKSLQAQFIARTIKKRYVALLSGLLEQDEGIINLPMRGDFDDRPRQLVCFEHGKPAETKWQVISRKDGKTKVYLSPKTGRTHQLRVHSAHVQGLNMPIIGDDLYGIKANRLHLHAELLVLNHPSTKELMTFSVEAEF
ncbi:RNA pseudouridine synthase [Shewanella hanedai]|uniref:RNA pseudouridine synthase n=1 Tax=Shewanella hanedai TaxID=25 RepID=A0A553JSE2_SHEHA|nr:RluA family pseudouridine synthase [Shewanella hanedai]TRY15377.1 RNA pseudouridine synthase [Shewanella hanedai]GGI98055.1 RNA pseudouridine synthase [Shewanella hanedai]